MTKAKANTAWLMTESNEQKLAKEFTEWHGCATGDCPHELYSECFDAAYIAGRESMRQELPNKAKVMEWIREWRSAWMKDEYRKTTAFNIDSNMIHSLADRLTSHLAESEGV